jgi:YggT family protein
VPTGPAACRAKARQAWQGSLPFGARSLAQRAALSRTRLPPARRGFTSWRDAATPRRPDGKDATPMLSILQIIMLILDVAWFLVIIHIILSWLINFQVLNLRQPIVGSIWDGLNRLLEPIYVRIRRFMPDLGGIDLAPLVLLIGIFALQTIIRNNAHLFV